MSTSFFRPVIGTVEVVHMNLPAQEWLLHLPERSDKEHLWTFVLSVDIEEHVKEVYCHLRLDTSRLAIWLPWHRRPEDYRHACISNGVHIEGSDEQYNEFLNAIIYTARKRWPPSLLHRTGLSSRIPVGPFRDQRVWHQSDVQCSRIEREPQRLEVLIESLFSKLPEYFNQQHLLVFMRALNRRPGKERASERLQQRFGLLKRQALKFATDLIKTHPTWFDRNVAASAYRLSPIGVSVLRALETQIGDQVDDEELPLFTSWLRGLR